MKPQIRFALVGTLIVAAMLLISFDAPAVPPEDTSKKIQLICKPGWNGGAVGEYGGVTFGLACQNGRATTMIDNTVGTAYTIRMGVENESAAFDCLFTGDAQNVNETCVEVRITIR